MFAKSFGLTLLLTLSLQAQNGDVRDTPGSVQQDPIPADKIPPSPTLPPTDALKTFKIQPGFHIELVASEPLVQDPIALTFAPDGRVWVVEMAGYMPNVDGVGEDQPVGKIVVLEDSPGSGRLDKRVVFADHLVLPRGISLANGGLLVAEPPHLWFYQIRDGDKAGERTEIASDLGNNYNPQGEANGFMWGLDNWIYCASYIFRFRVVDGEWQRGPTIRRGEWGISEDEYGRLVYNSNEDQFRIDLIPAEYLMRNPNYRFGLGVNVDPIHDQTVWPVHMTPGVNRGYWKDILRPDGTLAKTTAACGPLIYRGDNFPAEYRGNAFVCEPAGNLVIRDILTEKDGQYTGRKAYEHEDFLASTDERFRPTSLYNGPDGAIYLTDFYRGVLEHKLSLTTYLRKQIKARNLEQPLGLGRIYRIYHGDVPPVRQTLEELSSAQLVGKLASPEGWVQDTAQRLLVERANASVAPALRLQTLQDSNPIVQVHSAWTLEGMNQLDMDTVLQMLGDAHAKVRAAAIRLSEPFMRSRQSPPLFSKLLALAQSDTSPEVQWQLGFSLGQTSKPEGNSILLALADHAANDPMAREAIASSLYQREGAFIVDLTGRWKSEQPGFAALLGTLAQCVLNERDTNKVDQLLQLAASAQPWQQKAILHGMADRISAHRIKPLLFATKPDGLTALEKDSDTSMLLTRISPFVVWPGKPGYTPPAPVPPLTADEQNRFDAGKQLFATTCASCHQLTGLGQPGFAPPLADSEWVLGSEQRLGRIVLQGAQGPIKAAGVGFDSSMPSWASLDDKQLAGILTYIRRNWENSASPIAPETIASIRSKTVQRHTPWTAPELNGIP